MSKDWHHFMLANRSSYLTDSEDMASDNSKVVSKRLAIILKDYPYKRGEPYFHREISTLVEHFDEIILFSRHVCTENEQFHFELPQGVRVVNIGVRQSWRTKALTLMNAILTGGLWNVISDLRSGNIPLNLLTLKTALAYDDLTALHGKAIESALEGMGRRRNEFIWYSYWCDEAAYLLAKWRNQGHLQWAVCRTHSFDIYASRHPYAYLPFRQYIADNLTAIVCISQHGQQFLQSRHQNVEDTFKVIYLGVQASDCIQMEARQPLKLLSLSNIVPIKNIEAIIQALARWEGIPVHWHHIGGGTDDPYELSIIKLAREKLGKKRNIDFTFHGFIPPAEVMGKLAEMKPHALINSSYFEGIPVSMMEVASLGIPIIGPHICGVPEIVVDGENGFTFHPIDAEQLLASITKLVNLSDDEYDTMCRRSREIQQNLFSSSKNYRLFADFLLSMSKKK